MRRLLTRTRTPLAGTNKTSITCEFLPPADLADADTARYPDTHADAHSNTTS